MNPAINMKATGSRLRRMMGRKGLSVKDIQEYLGLSCVQSVYRWMNGCSMPSIDNLYALSELLGVPMDDIIVGNRTCRRRAPIRLFYVRMLAYYSCVRALRTDMQIPDRRPV